MDSQVAFVLIKTESLNFFFFFCAQYSWIFFSNIYVYYSRVYITCLYCTFYGFLTKYTVKEKFVLSLIQNMRLSRLKRSKVTYGHLMCDIFMLIDILVHYLHIQMCINCTVHSRYNLLKIFVHSASPTYHVIFLYLLSRHFHL